MKIQTKLISWLVTSTALVLFIMATILLLVINNELDKMLQRELNATMQAVQHIVNSAGDASVKSYLRGKAGQANLFCDIYYEKELSGELSREEAILEVKKLLKNEQIGKVGITGYITGLNSDGIAVIHPSMEGADFSAFDFVNRGIELKEGYIEYQWKNKEDEKERKKAAIVSYFEPWDIIFFASSYYDEFLSMIHTEDFREKLFDLKVGETGYPYIMNMKGDVIVHPHLEGVNLYDMKDADGNNLIREILQNEKEQGKLTYNWQNKGEKKPREKVVLYKKMKEMSWVIAISAYTKEFQVVQKYIIQILSISITVAISILTIIIIAIGRSIGHSANIIQKTVSALAKGDLTIESSISGSNEFRLMADSCNRMAREFNAAIRAVKGGIDSNKTSAGILASHSSEVSATATEISANMGSMKSGMSTLNSEFQKTEHELKTMNSNMGTVSSLIEGQTISVCESSSAVEEMLANISSITNITEDKMDIAENLSFLAKEGEANMSETVRSIGEIEEYTSTIHDLINVINSVAAKTNLLSMNAAIEAAHAGDAGKGFSVVADEIRKLAETASVNAKDISASLKKITEKIESTSDLSQRTNVSLQNIVSGVTELTLGLKETLEGLQEMSAGSKQITVSMTTLNNSTEKVDDAGEKMKKSIGEIYSSQQEMTRMMDTYLNSITEVAAGTDEISNSMISLSELSTENNEGTQLLEKSVLKFVTSKNPG